MGETIHHECGLALIRLRQPLEHYRERYGDIAWGLRRLYLLMEKQHNRGQDGAGIGVVKFDMPPGEPYLRRVRSDRHNAIERVFDAVMSDVDDLGEVNRETTDIGTLKRDCAFLGEIYLGHLRYGTHSVNSRANCHPMIRKNNIASRNLAIAGNFNMTNSARLFEQLLEYGLNPVGESDTEVVLERLGYFLDREHDHLAAANGPGSFRGLTGRVLARAVSDELDFTRILTRAAQDWDGGYVFTGLVGNGDLFACRDPSGIRPGYYFMDDEVFAVASERAPLASVFDVDPDSIEPIPPGHVLTVKRDGRHEIERFAEPLELRQCTFERIYFSRGNDPEIYRQRKHLGRSLAPRVLDAIDHDVANAVISYVPNTAETAYLGLLEEIDHLNGERQMEAIATRLEDGSLDRAALAGLMNGRIRAEKIAHKDQRLRTFITHDAARRDLVLHIYDITRGVVRPEDTLIVIDDSIVRGTTMRESIITILSRLNPKRIVVASSAPPIQYPDCYGIDMSQLGRFIAFEAAIELLRDRNELDLLDEVEARCREQATRPPERMVNHVAAIYERFTLEEISAKIAELIRPDTITWDGEIVVIYQTIEGLREAMPEYRGDWYFTGCYPTPGGYAVLNRSFLNWQQQSDVRAY